MLYTTESSMWKAYQFSDPFAGSSFLVGNKVSQVFCRPDCDAKPKTNLKSEIKFLSDSDEATGLGFVPCQECKPTGASLIDVELLVKCVDTINSQIGFLSPLMDDNEDRNNYKIKENILESKKTNEEQILNVIESGRRMPLPNLSGKGVSQDTIANVNLSKNDSDHYRLVDLACRHLASAAAVNLFFPKKSMEPEDNSGDKKKKRRRGGVLGFKGLAAKSKLSAWHFHRVFKSVTGLTPKTYGDKCNEFLEKFKDSKYVNYNFNENTSSKFNQSSHTPLSSNSLSPVELDEGSNKRIKLESDDYIIPNTPKQSPDANSLNVTPPQSGFDFEFNSRAASLPDLTKLYQPQTQQGVQQLDQPQIDQPQFNQPQYNQPSLFNYNQDNFQLPQQPQMQSEVPADMNNQLFDTFNLDDPLSQYNDGKFDLNPADIDLGTIGMGNDFSLIPGIDDQISNEVFN